MVRDEVVEYLRQNLARFKLEELRQQLQSEGVSERDFEDSLREAQRTKRSAAGKTRQPPNPKLLAALGAIFLVGLALILTMSTDGGKRPGEEPLPQSQAGESGFVGHRGWVVRLPAAYMGLTTFKDAHKTHETVYFCKRGTDPSQFLDEGLYGQLGIVRVEVLPTPFFPNPAGIAQLTNAVSRKLAANGEKFTVKPLQIGRLTGIQVQVEAPYPRIEAYLVGQRDLYFFFAGQEDDIWRDIVMSLRDPRGEE